MQIISPNFFPEYLKLILHVFSTFFTENIYWLSAIISTIYMAVNYFKSASIYKYTFLLVCFVIQIKTIKIAHLFLMVEALSHVKNKISH